ncbi:LysR family transcriptional regulator [Paenibacillus piri]|uniref:LysR family transcriptional regulator n=1 Tax=Paenibacillus piri TaxID=2547395 RepID=A0A4R5KU50_9BACL|nr:LysR family transcriptional regulator [Paenibacillus piri]TDF98565.1 LysR family transcriptional regulator [Paenibacillus piri]
MTLEQIITFVAVYRLGSYSKAAESLYLPQPTVSHRVKQLERELGKPLLIRGKGGILLSEEGNAFLPYALNVLNSVERGREAVERLKQGLNGKLSIGCNNSFAASVMPSILESFIHAYPDIAIQVHCYSTQDQIKLMKNKQFQLGITRYATNDPWLTFRLLYATPVHAIVSARHPFAKRGSIRIQDLLKERLIVYQNDTLYRKTLDLTFNSLNLQYDIQYETNNLQLIKQMVHCNRGIFLSCPLFMQGELASGDIVALTIERNPFPQSQVFLMYNEEEMNSLDYLFFRHFESCMNALQAHVKDERPPLKQHAE